MNKQVQAKHIADEDVLHTVFGLSMGELPRKYETRPAPHPEAWVFAWDLEGQWSELPWKVVAAKLKTLVRRGLLEGCTCGCRGNFYLTPRGRELIGR